MVFVKRYFSLILFFLFIDMVCKVLFKNFFAVDRLDFLSIVFVIFINDRVFFDMKLNLFVKLKFCEKKL